MMNKIKNYFKTCLNKFEEYKNKKYRIVALWQKDKNDYRYYPQYRKWIFWFDVEFMIGDYSMHEALKTLYKYIRGHEKPHKTEVTYINKEELYDYAKEHKW